MIAWALNNQIVDIVGDKKVESRAAEEYAVR